MGVGAARLGTAQRNTQNVNKYLLGSLRLGPQVEPYHDLYLNLSHVPFVGNS